MHPPSGSRRNSSYICGTHRHGCFCGQTAKIRQNWPDKQFTSWLTAEESLSTQISDRVPRLRKPAPFQPCHRLEAEPAGGVLNNVWRSGKRCSSGSRRGTPTDWFVLMANETDLESVTLRKRSFR